MRARNPDHCNHICLLVPVEYCCARRWPVVRKLRDRTRHELRLLFVPTMPGNDFRQRRVLPAKRGSSDLRLCETTAAALSARTLNCALFARQAGRRLRHAARQQAHDSHPGRRCRARARDDQHLDEGRARGGGGSRTDARRAEARRCWHGVSNCSVTVSILRTPGH